MVIRKRHRTAHFTVGRATAGILAPEGGLKTWVRAAIGWCGCARTAFRRALEATPSH